MQKLLSARFLMAIMFSFTACIGASMGWISGELFAGIVMAVVSYYFNRERGETK